MFLLLIFENVAIYLLIQMLQLQLRSLACNDTVAYGSDITTPVFL